MSGLKETELLIPQRTSKPSCFTQLVGFGRHYQRKQTLMEAVTPKIDRFLPARTHTHAVWPRVSTKHESLGPTSRCLHLIWVYCLKPPFMQRRRVFQEVERWEFHRDQTSAMLHPHSLCSTAQFWQRDALLKKHYTRVLSTVYAWGEMRKPFPPGSKSTNKF